MAQKFTGFKKLTTGEMRGIKGGMLLLNPDCRCYRHDEPRPGTACLNTGNDPVCDDPEVYQYYCPCSSVPPF